MSKHNIFFIKSIIFALIICFIGTLFPMTTTINAHEKVDRDYEISADSDSDNPRLDKCNVLKYVDDQAFLSNGFVKRIPEDEDLNSYVFEREDGSRNLYMFSEDVKFETSDGTVIEKDISLQRYSDGYVTKQNNIHLFLPDHYPDGVRLSFENEELVFLPLSSNSDTIAYDYIDKISYQGAFGCNTELVYTPTLSGVKQDIVLNDYEGVNRFCYVVQSETLKPFSEDSDIFFADSYDAEYRFVLGPVYIYDSEGRFTSGELDVEQIGNNEWIITITAPMAFLESEATVFPVTIDPTISVQASISSAYIEDVAILSGLGNTATGAWSTVYTGFLSEATGISRTLVRLPGLINNSTYSSIPSALITSAKFCVYEQTTAGTGTVSLYNYVGTSWTENGATWNNVSYNGYSSLFDTQTPVGGTLVEFNITNLVKGWKNGTYSSASGFMLRKQNEGDGVNYHTFYSSESSYSSYRPYVEVSYTPILINLSKTAIDEGESMPLFATVPSGATLSWSNSGNNPNISVDSGGIVTGLKACTSPCTITATIVFQGNVYSATAQLYVKIPNGTYFLKNKSSERYADATGYSNGDEVLRWSLHGANNQRWEISYISNGLYSIKNKMSNKYLGVEAINSTTAITRQYSGIWDATKWYIAKTSSGAYRLYAKGNLTYGFVIGAASNSNNTIVNMTYTNNSDYKDEWILERMLPTNGYEITYSPGNWTGYVENCCNCYAYALNNQVYPGTNLLWYKQQMGYYKGANYMYSTLQENNIFNAVNNDYAKYNETFNTNLIFQRIGRYETCPAGSYKVALVASNDDYHWYRQDADGLWSHKRGLSSVKRTDESTNQKLIIDPYIADRGNYTVFLGYYAVSPWNEFLNTNDTVYCYYYGAIIQYDDLMNLLNSKGLLQEKSYSSNEIRLNTRVSANVLVQYERLGD